MKSYFVHKDIFLSSGVVLGARGSLVGWSTTLQARRSPVRVRDGVDCFNLPNPFSRTMALESTQPLTNMSARNLLGVKSGWHVGLTTLPPSVSWMSENIGASTSRNPKGLHGLYRDNFTLPYRKGFVLDSESAIQVNKEFMYHYLLCSISLTLSGCMQ
jgi:hypothetical protein